jgi:hypothetical protein
MNKTEVKARLNEIDKQEYEAEIGNDWQQDHAKLVEQFLAEPTEELETIAQALYGLQDLQVRDYAMGILDKGNLSHKHALEKLMKYSPAKYLSPAKTLMALYWWESGNIEQAEHLLAQVKGYPLADLLKRTMSAGWQASAFQLMREELHPKVSAGIFGELAVA